MADVRERPILFSGPMVRAILAGQKTQTRRVVKLRYPWEMEEREEGVSWPWYPDYVTGGDWDGWVPCPYGQPGNRLWVREAHSIHPTHGQHRADGVRWGPWGGLPTTLSEDGKQIAYYREGFNRCDPGRWRPSIHMPRWACRLVLEITDVRVERLQAISEADAQCEGAGATVDHTRGRTYRDQYRDIWTTINGAASWEANPWVWVVDFKRACAEVGTP